MRRGARCISSRRSTATSCACFCAALANQPTGSSGTTPGRMGTRRPAATKHGCDLIGSGRLACAVEVLAHRVRRQGEDLAAQPRRQAIQKRPRRRREQHQPTGAVLGVLQQRVLALTVSRRRPSSSLLFINSHAPDFAGDTQFPSVSQICPKSGLGQNPKAQKSPATSMAAGLSNMEAEVGIEPA